MGYLQGHQGYQLGHCSVGPLVHWSIGPSVPWSIGPLVECQMSIVNMVKLLPEHTSGVPLIIVVIVIIIVIFLGCIAQVDLAVHLPRLCAQLSHHLEPTGIAELSLWSLCLSLSFCLFFALNFLTTWNRLVLLTFLYCLCLCLSALSLHSTFSPPSFYIIFARWPLGLPCFAILWSAMRSSA